MASSELIEGDSDCDETDSETTDAEFGPTTFGKVRSLPGNLKSSDIFSHEQE
jgi:hypothetical protein